jgi:hypothetical protein
MDKPKKSELREQLQASVASLDQKRTYTDFNSPDFDFVDGINVTP